MYQVIAYDNNYPNKGGIATLVGEYDSKEFAEFIQAKVKDRFLYSNYELKEVRNTNEKSEKRA